MTCTRVLACTTSSDCLSWNCLMVHLQWGGQGSKVQADRHRPSQDPSDRSGSHTSGTSLFTAAGASSADRASPTAQCLRALGQQLGPGLE